MTCVLVTGANGFVGRHLCRVLAEKPAVRLVTPGLVMTPSPGRWETDDSGIDLRDAAAVSDLVSMHRPDVVIHLAAQASVGRVLAGAADETWAVNVDGTRHLADAVARVTPAATVLFTSSGEVYGGNFGRDPVDEGVPVAPLNDYARSKLAAETLLADQLGAANRLIVVRPFNHTGPGQREDFVLASFAAQVARCEAGLQAPVIRVGNLDAARDFLDVRDVVAVYAALMHDRHRLPPRVLVNVASGTAWPLRALLDRLVARARCPIAVQIDPARLRPSDVPVACGSARYLRELIDWRPTIDIDAMLADLLADARQVVRGAAATASAKRA